MRWSSARPGTIRFEFGTDLGNAESLGKDARNGVEEGGCRYSPGR
jgi:hypothetical protein